MSKEPDLQGRYGAAVWRLHITGMPYSEVAKRLNVSFSKNSLAGIFHRQKNALEKDDRDLQILSQLESGVPIPDLANHWKVSKGTIMNLRNELFNEQRREGPSRPSEGST